MVHTFSIASSTSIDDVDQAVSIAEIIQEGISTATTHVSTSTCMLHRSLWIKALLLLYTGYEGYNLVCQKRLAWNEPCNILHPEREATLAVVRSSVFGFALLLESSSKPMLPLALYFIRDHRL